MITSLTRGEAGDDELSELDTVEVEAQGIKCNNYFFWSSDLLFLFIVKWWKTTIWNIHFKYNFCEVMRPIIHYLNVHLVPSVFPIWRNKIDPIQYYEIEFHTLQFQIFSLVGMYIARSFLQNIIQQLLTRLSFINSVLCN